MDLEVIAVRDGLRTLKDEMNRRLDSREELDAVRQDLAQVMSVLGVYEEDDDKAIVMALAVIQGLRHKAVPVDESVIDTNETTYTTK